MGEALQRPSMYNSNLRMLFMGKTAVVTGGNKGIGLHVTRMLLEAGCDVCVVARDFSSFPLGLEKKVRMVPFDLSEVEKIPTLVQEIGDVDILVNNAGVMFATPYGQYTQERAEAMLRINLKAPVALITAVSSSMITKGGGRIVNNASLAGQTGHPDIWYGIAKAGLINATKSFARILGGKGIVVNAVAPGPAETDMLDLIQEARKEGVLRSVYSGRFARADEVARTIVWLATESPEYINGTCIDINNGSFPR
jgi:3-oxoacyl-[acyl-carrier protein] reductase